MPRHGVPAAAPARLGLLVMRLDAAPVFVSLVETVVLGRDDTCDVYVDDAAASRRHTRITPEHGHAYIEDLGSRNGTFVAGRRVAACDAPPGTVLRVGDTLAWILAETEPWELPDPQAVLVGGLSLAPILRLIGLVGPTDLRVLVLGESGTGKELVARALHAASHRSGPFVPVNCAALPAALVESELFGHARGAFTGADRARRGLFQAALGGTLFLDEIGDLDVAAQAKLLRTIEDGEVRPVGSDRGDKIDVRIIAATNRDIGRAVEQGGFRPELRARLGEVEIALPPLRSRTEDLAALCRHLLHRWSGQSDLRIDADAMEALAIYDWPLNVRELDNVLRTAALGQKDVIQLADLPKPLRERWLSRRLSTPVTAEHTIATVNNSNSRERVERALRESEGNMRRAALALGVARGHLYRLTRRWNLDLEHFRRGTEIAVSSTGAGTGNEKP